MIDYYMLLFAYTAYMVVDIKNGRDLLFFLQKATMIQE